MEIRIVEGKYLTDSDLKSIVNILSIDSGDQSKKKINKPYLDWKLVQNPYGSYVVFCLIDGILIGFLSYTGKFIDKQVVFELGDVIVKPEGRGKGIFFRMLRKFHKEFPELTCYGTPNEAALPIEIKAGYQVQKQYIKYSVGICRIPVKKILSKIYLSELGSLLEVFFSKITFPLRAMPELTEPEDYSDRLCSVSIQDAEAFKWRILDYPGNYRYFGNNEIFFAVKVFKRNEYTFAFIVAQTPHSIIDSLRLMSSLSDLGIHFIVEMRGEQAGIRYPMKVLKNVPFISIGPCTPINILKFNACDGDNV